MHARISRLLEGTAAITSMWWRGGPDYRERFDYFIRRGLLAPIQRVVSACAVALGVIAVTLMTVGGEPWQLAIRGAGAAVAAFWAVRWLRMPLPSERAAVVFLLTANIGIFLTVVADSDVMAGAFGLVAMSLTAIFAAFMLSPRLFVANAVLSSAAISYSTIQLFHSYGWELAMIKTVLLAASVVGIPLAVQVGMAFLSQDASDADSDPLTGILNRRGFQRQAAIRIAEALERRRFATVSVVLVDVNDFKDINDRHGHDLGDNVLVGIAAILRRSASEGLIARLGGDEFAVLLAGGRSIDHAHTARRIAESIEAEPVAGTAVTSSVGIAVGTLSTVDMHAVDVLLARADEAMYEAKRDRTGTVVTNTVLEFPTPGAA